MGGRHWMALLARADSGTRIGCGTVSCGCWGRPRSRCGRWHGRLGPDRKPSADPTTTLNKWPGTRLVDLPDGQDSALRSKLSVRAKHPGIFDCEAHCSTTVATYQRPPNQLSVTHFLTHKCWSGLK